MSVPRCAPTWGALFRGILLNVAGIALVTVPASGLVVRFWNGPAIGSLDGVPHDHPNSCLQVSLVGFGGRRASSDQMQQ
jgi:hypothetical protein